MNEIWANRLIAGDKVWSNVPVSRRNAVKAALSARVESGIIDADLYCGKKDIDRYTFSNDIEAINWFLSIPVEENPIPTFYAAYILRWGFVGDKDYDWYVDDNKYKEKAINLFLKCYKAGYMKAGNMIGYMFYTKEYKNKSIDSYSTAAMYLQEVIKKSSDKDDILNAKKLMSNLKNKGNKWVKIHGAEKFKSAWDFLPKSPKKEYS